MTPDWKTALGWRAELEPALAPFTARGLEPARVTLVYRKHLKVRSHRGEHWARTGGKLQYHAEGGHELPAVGDWVAARIPDAGEALVHAVLPRRSAFVRKEPGEGTQGQVLAANLDTVLVVMGLDQDFSVRRLERFLTLAFESGARPVVALNKKDLAPDAAEKVERTRAIARQAEVHAVSALSGEGLAPLAGLFGPGQTVALLGSSGVGKSTLVNRLAGAALMETGEVRDDGRGRHTTTRRELLLLPSGGAVIDTPGLREVQMWAAEEGLARSFDDLEALAQRCRFADCRHDAEPGCAVKAALADGTLEAKRFESWVALGKEMAWLQRPADTRGRPGSKRRERVGHGVRRK